MWQRELETVNRMVAGHVATMVAEADQSEAFRDDGHVSVRNWVMAETNCPLSGGAAGRVDVPAGGVVPGGR